MEHSLGLMSHLNKLQKTCRSTSSEQELTCSDAETQLLASDLHLSSNLNMLLILETAYSISFLASHVLCDKLLIDRVFYLKLIVITLFITAII